MTVKYKSEKEAALQANVNIVVDETSPSHIISYIKWEAKNNSELIR